MAGNLSPGDWRATPSFARGTVRGLTSVQARFSRQPASVDLAVHEVKIEADNVYIRLSEDL